MNTIKKKKKKIKNILARNIKWHLNLKLQNFINALNCKEKCPPLIKADHYLNFQKKSLKISFLFSHIFCHTKNNDLRHKNR